VAATQKHESAEGRESHGTEGREIHRETEGRESHESAEGREIHRRRGRPACLPAMLDQGVQCNGIAPHDNDVALGAGTAACP
jgi:hypothetical protein